MTTLTSQSEDGTSPARAPSPASVWWPRLRPVLLAVTFPIVLLAVWHFATVGRPASLIPPPYEVWLELRDLAFGGIPRRFAVVEFALGKNPFVALAQAHHRDQRGCFPPQHNASRRQDRRSCHRNPF